MKKSNYQILASILVIFAATFAFISCEKKQINSPAIVDQKSITVNPSSANLTASRTRTLTTWVWVYDPLSNVMAGCRGTNGECYKTARIAAPGLATAIYSKDNEQIVDFFAKNEKILLEIIPEDVYMGVIKGDYSVNMFDGAVEDENMEYVMFTDEEKKLISVLEISKE